jgi:hypothetical protein
MSLTLDENHVYHVDSRPVPVSVTGLLKYAGLVDETWFNEYGRRRGELTHLAIEYYNGGILDEDTLDPVLRPYFQSYVKFLVDSGFVVVGSEIPVYSHEWNFAGTIDIEGYFKRSPLIYYIGDSKTGKVQPWTAIQTALYRLARGKFRRRFGLELRANGTYKMKFYDNPGDVVEAISIAHKWRSEHGTGTGNNQ